MELDSFSVDNFIQRLPQDIINSIIPYTYQPQSEILLKDIRNYSKTINLIRNFRCFLRAIRHRPSIKVLDS